MPGDSFCIQYTNCEGCPRATENILVHRNLPKGEHIPKDKCTQNCMLFMIKGELLINSEEYPGNTLRTSDLYSIDYERKALSSDYQHARISQ